MGLTQELSDLGMSSDQIAMALYVQSMLGYPVMKVELCASNYVDIVEDAELWLMTYVGQVKRNQVTLVAGQVEYEVPSDVEMVLDVAFPGRGNGDSLVNFYANPLTSDDLSGLPSDTLMGGQKSGGMVSGIVQELQYWKLVERALSSDRMWHWDRPSRTLTIRPQGVGGIALYWYASTRFEYTFLSSSEKSFLRRRAVAIAKMTLGNIRSKYDAIPGASGSISMNGSDLVAQAQEEIITLTEDLMKSRPPVPFLIG